MKAKKMFCIAALAVLLFAPATAMAKTHISFSLNLFDVLAPRLVPAPVVVAPVPPPVYYIPCPPPPPRIQKHTIVKEVHYYHHLPQEEVEEINPHAHAHYYHYPR